MTHTSAQWCQIANNIRDAFACQTRILHHPTCARLYQTKLTLMNFCFLLFFVLWGTAVKTVTSFAIVWLFVFEYVRGGWAPQSARWNLMAPSNTLLDDVCLYMPMHPFSPTERSLKWQRPSRRFEITKLQMAQMFSLQIPASSLTWASVYNEPALSSNIHSTLTPARKDIFCYPSLTALSWLAYTWSQLVNCREDNLADNNNCSRICNDDVSLLISRLTGNSICHWQFV